MFLELAQSLLHGVLCHFLRGQLLVKMETFRVVPSNGSQSIGSQFLWLDTSKPEMYPAFSVLPIFKGKKYHFPCFTFWLQLEVCRTFALSP